MTARHYPDATPTPISSTMQPCHPISYNTSSALQPQPSSTHNHGLSHYSSCSLLSIYVFAIPVPNPTVTEWWYRCAPCTVVLCLYFMYSQLMLYFHSRQSSLQLCTQLLPLFVEFSSSSLTSRYYSSCAK